MGRTLESTDKTSYTLLEPGTYDGYFKGYEEIDLEFGPCLKMFWEVQTEEGEEEIQGIASLPKNGNAMTPRHKLRQWLEGMRGKPLAEGEKVDIDAMIGTECRVLVSTEEKAKKDGTKGNFNVIVKTLPPRKRSTKPAAADDLV